MSKYVLGKNEDDDFDEALDELDGPEPRVVEGQA